MLNEAVVIRLHDILTVYGYKRIVGPTRHSVLQPKELLEILVVGVLSDISGNGNLITIGGGRVVSNSIVKLPETVDSDLQD